MNSKSFDDHKFVKKNYKKNHKKPGNGALKGGAVELLEDTQHKITNNYLSSIKPMLKEPNM